MQARETQMMGGVKRENRKKTVDSIAASYILESYLEREKNKVKKEKKGGSMKEKMKKFIANPAQSYVTPEVEVVEIVSEGVLCQSGNFEQWGEETLPW